jgi:septal ring factor EnvC (AmiA/AmiB activator)
MAQEQRRHRHYSSSTTLDVLGEKVEANADQMNALTVQVSKLAEQVAQLTTALGVAVANTTNLTKRIEKLETREDAEVTQKEQHTFQLNQNMLGWVVAIAMMLMNAIMNGTIRLGR